MIDLVRRQAALEKTLAKYAGRAIDWAAVDCVRMGRSHLVAMGHTPLPRIPRYSSAEGALRALKKAGHASIEALFDSLLPRIAPAAMLPGDVALMQGDEHFDAVTLCVGHKLWGWHQENGLREPLMMIPETIKRAWRA
jgi:hypothetical protein